jgi:hypothetical protein
LKQQVHRILCLRELAFGNFMDADQRSDIWAATEMTDQTVALRKVCSLGGCCSPKWDCAPLQKTRMRLAAYLGMINTEESLALKKELERK